jgi:hypothetical protein
VELASDSIKIRLEKLDDSVASVLGDSMAVSPHLEEDDILNPEADETIIPENPDAIGVELHDTTPKDLDEYLQTDIMIP